MLLKQLFRNDKLLISKEMKRYLEPEIMITFERVKQLNRTKAGKLKQFTSLYQT